LEESWNPFAILVMAHLRTQTTRRNPESRLQWKLRLVKGLYRRGLSREDVLELFRVIDWMMALPEELARGFQQELQEFEETTVMPYVTSIERLGRQQALREAVMDNLEARFGTVTDPVRAALETIRDEATLKTLHRQAITVESIEAFREALPSTTA
jgi:hypothetical protein